MQEEQAVIVSFDYGTTDLSQLFALEDALEEVLLDSELGEYDGHEIAVDGSDGLLFLYGPSADALFEHIKNTLIANGQISNVQATLRYGPPEDGVKELVVTVKL
jgi:hypothetical protein